MDVLVRLLGSMLIATGSHGKVQFLKEAAGCRVDQKSQQWREHDHSCSYFCGPLKKDGLGYGCRDKWEEKEK